MSPLDTVMFTPNPEGNPAHCQTPTEQRVIRQLFEALLFEQIIDYRFDQGRFSFQLGNTQYEATGYVAGFSRVRINNGSIQVVSADKQRHAPELTVILQDLPTNDAVKAKLTEQLDQTIRLCQWNAEHLNKQPSRVGLSFLDLESQLDEGHPYHPCFKARTGFTLEDHQAYGPECANPIQLHWLAVRRTLLDQSLPGMDDKHFWQQEIGITGWQALQETMNLHQLSWNQYTLLPIHPWQWQALKDRELSTPLKTGELIYLGAAGDLYQASISVRTLMNISHPDKANIKLPMNMINTSSLRKLDSHAVSSAPTISNWLQQAIKDDPFLQKKERKAQPSLILLSEYAGITLPTPSSSQAASESWQASIPGQLGVIFRESLQPYLKANQDAMPFTALYVEEQDGTPLIKSFIERYGLESWLSQLIDVTIVPVWHLLVKHGLALEAHGQNMVLAHSNGWPQALILRDFHDSFEYVEDYLAKPALKPDFDQLNPCYRGAPDNQYYWMDSVEALRELVIDTLFVFNLSELACLMERHFEFGETDFWTLVYQRLQNYAQQGYCEQSRLDRMPINQLSIRTESLINKKLADTEADYFHHAISNPFAGMSPLSVEPQQVTQPHSKA